jgi:ElaB/YqjD/DUF883 family membrane-anchored ribosome-binding protein
MANSDIVLHNANMIGETLSTIGRDMGLAAEASDTVTKAYLSVTDTADGVSAASAREFQHSADQLRAAISDTVRDLQMKMQSANDGVVGVDTASAGQLG